MCEVAVDCARKPKHNIVVADRALRACGRCLAVSLRAGVVQNTSRIGGPNPKR